MRRKLVKQGAATMMVSLPSKWIKGQRLKKGDEISIQEADNSLIISSEIGDAPKRAVRINITNQTESSIRTLIVNAYRFGYDVIEVVFNDEKEYLHVLNTLKNFLIGFDVTRKENTYCILENITEPSEEQFPVLFKKILYNILLMINSTQDRLKNKTSFEDYAGIDAKTKQYQNFCTRVIAKKNPIGNKAPLFWTFLGLLIHGQRELYHMNKFLDKNKINFKHFELLKKLRQIFELLSEGYLKKDIKKLEKIHELEKEIIYKDFYKLIQKGGKENIVLYHIVLAVKNFYLSSSPLMGLLLESSKSK